MIFEYSYWFLLPIVLFSFAIAYLKFRKMAKLPDVGRAMCWVISSLRFMVLFVLLFLLLNPALSLLRYVKEKPLLIVAQDNSASLLNGKDSLYYKNEYKEFLESKLAVLRDRFDVEVLTFAGRTERGGEIDFSGTGTDISGVFDYVDRNCVYRRPEVLLLLSDGIYNTGVNPRYKMSSFPVYTVSLGDTTQYPDVYVKSLMCDKFHFMRTVFPMKVEISAIREKGKQVKCLLHENGNLVGEKVVVIDKDNFFTDVVFDVEAKQKGVMKYVVTLEAVSGERSKENNRAVTYVNIVDNSAEIAIFYTSPHPDVAALVGAIQVSGIYQCAVHSLNDPVEELKSNLIILHNPEPEHPNYQKIMKMAASRKISVWNILTTSESMERMARFGKAYSTDFMTNTTEYVTPDFNGDFPFFEFTEQEINGIQSYPPLVVPFGKLRSGAGRLLFTQMVKTVPSENGMISFYDDNSIRSCYFWGEGLWRWRLYSYKENGSHELFNMLVHKIVNYLAVNRGDDRFVHDIKPLYDETEETVIHVELYNESFELVNTPDVKLTLKNGEHDFSYVLNRDRDKYRISLGNLQEGEYGYTLSTNLKGENFEKKGSFYVRTRNVEINDILANQQLLKEIAENSGGKAIDFANFERLTDELSQNDDFKLVYKSEVKYMDLDEMSVIGLILLFLICIEWFLLKYFIG